MSERDPLQNLWTQQKEETFSMSIADIHVRAARFQAGVRQRNWREHIVAAVMVGVFGWIGWMAPDLAVKIGAALIVLGIVYVSVQLATKARAGSAQDLASAKTWAVFYREELMRQYMALRDVWRWYLAPLAPGLLVLMAGASFAPDRSAPLFAKAILFGVCLLIVAVVFWGVAWINLRAARQIKAQIDAIDAARGEA